LLAPSEYSSGIQIVPIVLLALLVFGLSYPLNIGIMLKGRTELASLTGILAAGACLLLNALLIPRYGMLGAAWATVFAYTVFTSLMFRVSARLYPIHYPARPLIGAGILLVGGAASLQMVTSVLAEVSPVLRAGAGLVAVTLIVGVVALGYRRDLIRLTNAQWGSNGDREQA
jgi:O-antigen/teichoic acid export membrane protein